MHARWQLRRPVLRQQRSIAIELHRSEFARLDFVTIVPIAAAETFREVARDREIARGPLADHVEVFVQHQRTVREELLAAAAKVDAVASSGGDRAPMEAHVDAVLNDLDVPHGLAEQTLEREAHVLRGITAIAYPHVIYLCKTSRRSCLTSHPR